VIEEERRDGEETPPEGSPEVEHPEDEGADSSITPPGERPPEEEGEPAPQPEEERDHRPSRRSAEPETAGRDEVVPGADLEPDLVLEQPPGEEDEYGDAAYAERYAEAEAAEAPPVEEAEEPPEREEAPAALTPRELAADARYQATGKRKTAVARVILKPGSGSYTVNGAALEDFFPRHALQKTARQPLLAAGYERNMDVVARLHGGGVSSQAGALRHGIARALAEADPALRGEMKRRGYLTRDARVKERKKAGLKKARKRPQFSKR
jgi:small subunit ribosomal protein S9